MVLRAMVLVTLFSSWLGAAELSSSDIFKVRSFSNPEAKAKVPVTSQLFTKWDAEATLQTALKEAKRNTSECSIPLLQAKPGKVNDGLSQPAAPTHDSGGSMKPPVPACKGWN